MLLYIRNVSCRLGCTLKRKPEIKECQSHLIVGLKSTIQHIGNACMSQVRVQKCKPLE